MDMQPHHSGAVKIRQFFRDQQQIADRALIDIASNPTALDLVASTIADKILGGRAGTARWIRQSLRSEIFEAIALSAEAAKKRQNKKG